MGWEAERAEDAYWMHGPNWPFDDSDYSPDPDADPWRVADHDHAPEWMAKRQRRSRDMSWTDEERRRYIDTGHEHRAMGHGGWQIGVARSGKISPMLLLDALAKAAMGSELEQPRFPSEPPDGSVLKWVKTFKRNPEQGYTYVALHVNGAWYLTGRNTDPITWDELVALIGDNPCELATNWMEIPKPKKDDLDGLTPEEWFLVAFPQDTVDAEQDGQG